MTKRTKTIVAVIAWTFTLLGAGAIKVFACAPHNPDGTVMGTNCIDGDTCDANDDLDGNCFTQTGSCCTPAN